MWRHPPRPCCKLVNRGNGGAWRGRSLSLILHDPFAERATLAAGKSWPLASDRTTALAVQVNRGRGLRTAAVIGVLASDLGRFEEGLYSFCAHINEERFQSCWFTDCSRAR